MTRPTLTQMVGDRASSNSNVRRSQVWHQVWDGRDPEKLRHDGFEAQLPDDDARARWRDAQVRFIAETLRLDTRDHLLDLGCGTGMLTERLAHLVSRVTAVDYSSDAVAMARRWLAPFDGRVEVVHCDLARLDYERYQFNKALAVSCLHYLDDYATLHDVLTSLSRRGPVLAMDLPDEAFQNETKRDYDQTRWSHLYVRPSKLADEFPGSVIHRAMFPSYANDALRFSILIPPHSS